jgi:DNA-binding NtrC family response regulator
MSQSGIGVLLVEDDAAIADLYMLKLSMDGYTVHHAADGTTAQVIFERAHPLVVCVDARLPDGSGLSTARMMADRGACVILLTNDQACYETPPAGVRLALIKARTSPGELSTTIRRLTESANRKA